ncbi:MAG: methionyl-tRNA synthetase [Candidatus Midichloriaceae bacterium]|jgi:methionyl-tRNA synthetase
MVKNNFYITTPIYYVNDIPHIGHAYTNIVADVIARFKKLDGFNVKFITGTDEHGQKVEKSAKKLNLEPQKFVDKIAQNFINLSKDLNLINNDFIRTTELRHKNFVSDIWKKLEDKKQIYLDKYAGWYSIRDEAYYADSELIDGKAPTGADVEWIEESSYFFKLSEWEDRLLEFYDKNPEFIKPIGRRNEVISFVKSGLQDLSISRTAFKWGIKVPNNSDHVIYVWMDALFNYMSVLGNESSEFWPANLHIVGKDILRFHAVYWPAFLMAADLAVPNQIFAHGWWTNEGQKISKSVGNTIDPYELINDYGLDYFRYYLIKEVTLGDDGNFLKTSFIERVNAELVNKLGNLMHRTTNFIYKNCDKKIPAPSQYTSEDKDILSKAYNTIEGLRKFIDQQMLRQSLESIIELVSDANSYIDSEAPWRLKKTDVDRMNTVLYVLSEVIRVIGIVMQPFTPDSASKILDYFNVNERDFSIIESSKINHGMEIDEPSIIFNRIELNKA